MEAQDVLDITTMITESMDTITNIITTTIRTRVERMWNHTSIMTKSILTDTIRMATSISTKNMNTLTTMVTATHMDTITTMTTSTIIHPKVI